MGRIVLNSKMVSAFSSAINEAQNQMIGSADSFAICVDYSDTNITLSTTLIAEGEFEIAIIATQERSAE